jgi:DNA invertase Pin-like site-specific DNA recombinase
MLLHADRPELSGMRATAAEPVADSPVGKPEEVVALGYVSSTHGTGRIDDPELRAQTDQLQRLCEERGWTLAELVRESRVSRRPERPALDYAVKRLGCGAASCLVVARLEGLCRSVGELAGTMERLIAVSARLVCLEPEIDTATNEGTAALRVMMAVSSWERERIAQRTRKGLAAARANGVALRPAVVDRPELMEQILVLRAQGMTMQAIADRLNDEGVPTLRGGSEWRPSSVQVAVGYKRPTRRWTSE